MFVVRSANSFHSQPVWQQPAYEPFSAFLGQPRPTRRQPSGHLSHRPSYYPSQTTYNPHSQYYDEEDELLSSLGYLYPQRQQRSVRYPSDDELLLAQLIQQQQQQRRREDAETEAERLYRARVLRERQREALELQLLAERQRRAAWARQQQQEQLRQEQQQQQQQQLLLRQRQAEAEEQRRFEHEHEQDEDEHGDAFALRLQDALRHLLLGEPIAHQHDTQPTARLLVRRSEEQPKQPLVDASTPQLTAAALPITASARPASPMPVAAAKPASPSLPSQAAVSATQAVEAAKPASPTKPTTSPAAQPSLFSPVIRIRTIPITSSASAPSSPLPASLASRHLNTPASPVQPAAAAGKAASSGHANANTKRPASTPSITIPAPAATITSTASTSASSPSTGSKATPTRRGSVEIEDVPSSPDRLKADADEDVWAVEKRLHTPTPLVTVVPTTANAASSAATTAA